MIDRPVALTTVVLTLALVGAQVVSPAWAVPHTEPYAIALAVALIILLAYTSRAWGGRDGVRGKWLGLTTCGAALIALTGLASGLLGADAQTIARAPGTVEPLPDLRVAAFFPLVDASGIARGDARLVLRRLGGPSIDVSPGARRLIGTSVLAAEPHVAAYVEAYDTSGRRLTITQPQNRAFLSPVLQFATAVTIAQQELPADEFAVPALHRRVTAVYIGAREADALHAQRLGGRNIVLFSVRDESSSATPAAIGYAPSGGTARVGGLALRVTIGQYPQLLIGSAPLAAALWTGGAAMLAGIVLAALRGRAFAA